MFGKKKQEKAEAAQETTTATDGHEKFYGRCAEEFNKWVEGGCSDKHLNGSSHWIIAHANVSFQDYVKEELESVQKNLAAVDKKVAALSKSVESLAKKIDDATEEDEK